MNIEAARFFAKSKSRFFTALFLFSIHWIFGAMEFYIVLNCLGVKISIVRAIIIEMGVMMFKVLGSVILGQISIEEYGNKVMLNLIGVTSNEIGLVVSLTRRARQLFWLIIAAIFGLFLSKSFNLKRSGRDV